MKKQYFGVTYCFPGREKCKNKVFKISCLSFDHLFQLFVSGIPEWLPRVPVDPGNRDFPGNFPSCQSRIQTQIMCIFINKCEVWPNWSRMFNYENTLKQHFIFLRLNIIFNNAACLQRFKILWGKSD